MKHLILATIALLLPLPAHAVCVPWAKGYDYFERIPVEGTLPRYVVIAKTGTVIRSGAGTDSPVIAYPQKGDPFIKLGETFDRQCRQWLQVKTVGGDVYPIPITGWIRADLVQDAK